MRAPTRHQRTQHKRPILRSGGLWGHRRTGVSSSRDLATACAARSNLPFEGLGKARLSGHARHRRE
eukprot:1494705-Pyramimonas_sp.AAC.1